MLQGRAFSLACTVNVTLQSLHSSMYSECTVKNVIIQGSAFSLAWTVNVTGKSLQSSMYSECYRGSLQSSITVNATGQRLQSSMYSDIILFYYVSFYSCLQNLFAIQSWTFGYHYTMVFTYCLLSSRLIFKSFLWLLANATLLYMSSGKVGSVKASIFEPTCAYCMMGSYASLSVLLIVQSRSVAWEPPKLSNSTIQLFKRQRQGKFKKSHTNIRKTVFWQVVRVKVHILLIVQSRSVVWFFYSARLILKGTSRDLNG